jgi:UDP-galactopyranose mutase
LPFDYIIVGAGLAGITAAEELANVMNKKVLLIEKRDHIGGNCYDFVNENGTRIHKYGPHVFHTDNTLVYNYLSLFTMWNSHSHKLLFKNEDTLIPVPFNLISVDKILPEEAEDIKVALLEKYDIKTQIPIKELMESKNKHIKKLGEKIYEIFSNHLKKVYDICDEEILELIDNFLPFRTSYDCRYYKNVYQVIPQNGYTNMFNNMLSNHNITVMLNKDYYDIIKIDHENKKILYEDEEFKGHMIFTGRIDEFFDYKFGELPYRSSVLVNEVIEDETFQDIAVTFYPNEYHFTRITDYKYLSGEYLNSTVIQFEYPVKFDTKSEEGNIPFYPIPLEKNYKLYRKYNEISKEYNNVTFIGRLTEYKILQMDEVVEKVLNLISEKFAGLSTEY